MSEGLAVEPYVSDSHSVGFDLTPLQTGNASSAWMGSYTSRGKTARFRIELDPAKEQETKDPKDFKIATGKGRFVAEPGSDASIFLPELKKTLDAKTLPRGVQRAAFLPFTYVSFGGKMSQTTEGGLNTNPPGNWTALKLFLGEGDQEAEVFLNYNPVIGKAQFSIKDDDYGDLLLAQFAKVF
jgi:hypothetical protein